MLSQNLLFVIEMNEETLPLDFHQCQCLEGMKKTSSKIRWGPERLRTELVSCLQVTDTSLWRIALPL